MVLRLLIWLALTPAALAAPGKLVPWDSPESMQRLATSDHAVDLPSLTNHFVPQVNRAFCGVASATIVLNSLLLGKKPDIPYDPTLVLPQDRKYLRPGTEIGFRRFTQDNVFRISPKKRARVLGEPFRDPGTGKDKRDFGFQLRQLGDLFKAHGLRVSVHVVKSTGQKEQLRLMRENLRTKGNYLIINYTRKALGQKGGGHISPVAAWHKASDSFLVMDVNPNRAGWVWVPAARLMAAMATFDTTENRGFLQISRGQGG